MDYTPISARRILLGFAFTAFIAILPLLVVYLRQHTLPVDVFPDTDGGYRGVVLGIGSVVSAMTLVALATATVLTARRMARRPSRA